MERRQICWAHLVRKYVSFSERAGPAGELGRQLLDYTGLLFDYWHHYNDSNHPKEGIVAMNSAKRVVGGSGSLAVWVLPWLGLLTACSVAEPDVPRTGSADRVAALIEEAPTAFSTVAVTRGSIR